MANTAVGAILILTSICLSATAFGQQRSCDYSIQDTGRSSTIPTSEACAYNKMYSYSQTDTTARQIIVRVLDLISLPVNFSIEPCDGLNTCRAYVHDNGVRYIFYDQNFMNQLSASSVNNWNLIAILAHELGHHLCGHTLITADNALHRQNELQADKFAGAILARMGASSKQAYASLLSVSHPTCEQEMFNAYPCFEKRKQSVLDGYRSINPEQRDANFKLSMELDDVDVAANNILVGKGKVDLSDPNNPPRDQGQEASIVGFSVAYALEIEIKRKFNYLTQISPGYIYNTIGGTAFSGAFITDALDLVRNVGAIEESVWPYKPNDYHNSMVKSRADTTSNRYKIKDWYNLSISIDEFKSILKQQKAIIAGIRIPDYFLQDSSGSWILKSGNFNSSGSISICIVGFDDEKQLLKFKNSWGTGWGDHGFGYLRYQDMQRLTVSAYYLEM